MNAAGVLESHFHLLVAEDCCQNSEIGGCSLSHLQAIIASCTGIVAPAAGPTEAQQDVICRPGWV